METGREGSFARSRFSPTRVKRRNIVLLRGLLVFALGGLILQSDTLSKPLLATTLLALLAATNLALAFAPLHLLNRMAFELALGATDITLVALGLHLAEGGGMLPASCLLMVLIVALGNSRLHTVASASAIGVFHWWLVGGGAPVVGNGWRVALEILFLCSVGLYFGFLVRRIHHHRDRTEADRLERRELQALLHILDTISSSLDLREVALTVVEKLATVIPAVRCSMLFVDPNASRCFVLASHDQPDLDLLEIDLQKYPEVRRAIETRNPVLVQNVPSDPILAEVRQLLEGLDFHSILVVPLTFRRRVLGTLCLKTARTKEEFSEGDLNFCNAVARASANALQNALLHDQVLEEAGRHRRTGEKLQRILDHSPDLILTTDREGRITEVNQGAERFVGRTRGDVLDRHCEEVFGAGCDQALIDRIHGEGRLTNQSCEVVRGDGARRTLELNMAVLGERGDDSTGTVWIGRDVTELKSAQLQLLQAKKLSTIGEVISGVAHELNNPLSGVLGFAQLLLGKHATSPLGRDLEKIHEAAVRCQKIVKNLLAFARLHKPERKYLGVNGIIDKTLELRKYQLQVNDVEVVRRFDPELPRTMLDYHQIQQVLLNLVNNAQYAIEASANRPGRLEIETRLCEGRIRVAVSDNGVGMSQETLERIFDPFFTTKEPGRGTGLGLSVSYGIINEHGGRIYARSRPGEGSTFLLELPVRQEIEAVPEELSPAAAEQPGGAVERREASLLVVDDEPLILDLMVDIFSDQGYAVDTAANGAEACRKIRQRAYDLVITDVRMPEMNGIELYSHILSLRPELEGRVVFMTGDLIDKETVHFLTEVRASSIPKPLEVAAVIAAVEAKLESRQPC